MVCCCDFRDGAERLIPSKSLGNAVIRAFPGLFRILRMCAPRHAAAVVRPRERKKSADRRRRILISRLLIIRASVPRRKSPFPAYFKGFPAVSLLIPPYPAFLKYPVSPQLELIERAGNSTATSVVWLPKSVIYASFVAGIISVNLSLLGQVPRKVYNIIHGIESDELLLEAQAMAKEFDRELEAEAAKDSDDNADNVGKDGGKKE